MIGDLHGNLPPEPDLPLFNEPIDKQDHVQNFKVQFPHFRVVLADSLVAAGATGDESLDAQIVEGLYVLPGQALVLGISDAKQNAPATLLFRSQDAEVHATALQQLHRIDGHLPDVHIESRRAPHEVENRGRLFGKVFGEPPGFPFASLPSSPTCPGLCGAAATGCRRPLRLK